MKALNVYYSRRGAYLDNGDIRTLLVDNTEMAAMILQKLTRAELYQIVPVQDYPNEYCHCIDLARQDLLRRERPGLKPCDIGNPCIGWKCL